MRFIITRTVLLLLLILPVVAPAQQTLTLSAAMETALKRNFYINIARNDSAVAVNNNSLGNAGFMPTVDLTGGVSTSVNNTEQQYSNDNTVSRDKAASDQLQASLRLQWTLFDGMRMFAAKSLLASGEELSRYQLKAEMERVISEVILAYFEVVKWQQSIRVMEIAIQNADEQVAIAKKRFETGAASKLDFLQSKVDRDAGVSEMMRAQVSLDNAIGTLNSLMGNESFNRFTATDSLMVSYEPVLEELTRSVFDRNTEIKIGILQTDISDQWIREYRSGYFPQLQAQGAYNFTRTENEVGFLLFQENSGLNAGLSLTWNLFDGFNTRRNVKNARLQALSTGLLLDATRSKISRDLAVAFRKYESDRSILKLETESVGYAKENAEVATEAYRIGSISGIQLREARLSYEQAMLRLVNAAFDAKWSETTLMRLNGDLVK